MGGRRPSREAAVANAFCWDGPLPVRYGRSSDRVDRIVRLSGTVPRDRRRDRTATGWRERADGRAGRGYTVGAPTVSPDDRDPAPVPDEIAEAVPTWEDEYLDRVSDRLMHNYDLERDYAVAGESFPLYGQLRMVARKRFFHPALNYGDHERRAHVFARRNAEPTVEDVQSLLDLGHTLAEEWIDADEEHFETSFTFVLVADAIPEDVRSFVEGFRDRTLLKYGYFGHYEVVPIVVAPDRAAIVAGEAAELTDAFALWRDLDDGSESVLSSIADRLL